MRTIIILFLACNLYGQNTTLGLTVLPTTASYYKLRISNGTNGKLVAYMTNDSCLTIIDTMQTIKMLINSLTDRNTQEDLWRNRYFELYAEHEFYVKQTKKFLKKHKFYTK